MAPHTSDNFPGVNLGTEMKVQQIGYVRMLLHWDLSIKHGVCVCVSNR